MSRATLFLASCALLLVGGCSKSDSDPAPVPLAPQTATEAAMSFLLVEQSMGSPSSLPRWESPVEGQAKVLTMPEPLLPGCVASATAGNTDGSTTVTLTYACTGTDGSTLTGSLAITFNQAVPGSYLVEYRSLKATRGAESWTINGSKQISVDTFNKRAAVSTPTPITVVMATGTDGPTRTWTYTSNLQGDWATTGLYKVTGGYSLQQGTAAPLSCTITTALTWEAASGCCYPVSGVLSLIQTNASATVTFGLPCGTCRISGTPVPVTLPSCPN